MAKDFKQSKTGKYLVKPHNPWKQGALWGIGGLIILVTGWTCYELGIVQGGHIRAVANSESEVLHDQVAMLSQRIEELTMENAQLVSNSAIDTTANKQVGDRLRELNEEMLELKEELVFYRSLLSPAELEPGLQILGVKITKNTHQGTYNYKIVLTQRRNRNRHANGRVELTLNGESKGEAVELKVADMLEVGKSELQFRFKNFQSLEGQLRLPEDFKPQNIIISVMPKSRSLKTIERTYEWYSIFTGG